MINKSKFDPFFQVVCYYNKEFAECKYYDLIPKALNLTLTLAIV